MQSYRHTCLMRPTISLFIRWPTGGSLDTFRKTQNHSKQTKQNCAHIPARVIVTIAPHVWHTNTQACMTQATDSSVRCAPLVCAIHVPTRRRRRHRYRHHLFDRMINMFGSAFNPHRTHTLTHASAFAQSLSFWRRVCAPPHHPPQAHPTGSMRGVCGVAT